MKKILALLTLLFTTPAAFAQDETPVYKAAIQDFKTQYNAGDYAAVFHMLSPQFQAQLPLPQLETFLRDNVKANWGAIEKTELVGEKMGMKRYKVTCERGTFALLLGIDANSKVAGFQIKPYEEEATLPAKMARNTTKMALPFKGEWSVFWGGDTEEQNYHIKSKAQQGALDMMMRDAKGSSYKGDGKRNEDYYCFGKPLLAPCAAEVVLAVDGIKDNVPGIMNPMHALGNAVVLKTAGGEYLYFAHFKQYTIKVKPGQRVKTGEVLGMCGNSGNSSEPHLHFHLQDTEEMTEATGIKSYFEKVKVNGKVVEDVSPVQGDKVENL